MADQLQTLLGQLGDEECQVLELKMNDRSNEQIADILGCSERTVRRIVNKVQSRWQVMMDEAGA
jgi:FixJ family two-component response regulator